MSIQELLMANSVQRNTVMFSYKNLPLVLRVLGTAHQIHTPQVFVPLAYFYPASGSSHFMHEEGWDFLCEKCAPNAH